MTDEDRARIEEEERLRYQIQSELRRRSHPWILWVIGSALVLSLALWTIRGILSQQNFPVGSEVVLSSTALTFLSQDALDKFEALPSDQAMELLGPSAFKIPSGSAHELRRNGKRVVLLERGSFVVPGSLETRLIDDLIDTRTSMDGAIRIRNGMAVGGGSQVNVDLCFAPTSEAIRLKIEAGAKPGKSRPMSSHKLSLGANTSGSSG